MALDIEESTGVYVIPVEENHEFVTVTEAAELLGVNRQRVHYLLKIGRLPKRRVGPIYLIPRKAVLEFERQPRGRPRKRD
jgi:excisionase family DNA binding protein